MKTVPWRASFIALLALLCCRAWAEESTHAAPPDLTTVTVHAAREPKKLKEQIDNFVSSIRRSSGTDALARWSVPVCPLVAGVSRERAEYFLERLSQVARDAGAPLAPEECSPNFLIVITGQPDELLRMWQDRDPYMFNRDRRASVLKRFMNSDLPVRVWYNANSNCVGMETTFSLQSNVLSSTCRSSGTASRLTRQAVRVIDSAIVVVDKERIKGFKVGQVVDYVAIVGLAEIRENLGLVDAPSVLNLFADSALSKPSGLSSWDQAFLNSLYHINARALSQASEIKLRIFRDLVAEEPSQSELKP